MKKLYYLAIISFMERVRRLRKCTAGASSVEYAVLVALIGAIVVGGATLLGNTVNQELNDVAGAINPLP